MLLIYGMIGVVCGDLLSNSWFIVEYVEIGGVVVVL